MSKGVFYSFHGLSAKFIWMHLAARRRKMDYWWLKHKDVVYLTNGPEEVHSSEGFRTWWHQKPRHLQPHHGGFSPKVWGLRIAGWLLQEQLRVLTQQLQSRQEKRRGSGALLCASDQIKKKTFPKPPAGRFPLIPHRPDWVMGPPVNRPPPRAGWSPST